MGFKAIITGITGQDGAYLAALLLEKKYIVVGLVRDYANADLSGIDYLGIKDKIHIEECDMLNSEMVKNLILSHKPDEIYNLAAQSSVGISFSIPVETIQFNINSVLNILETIKKINKKIKFYQASSSEMYGKVNSLPINEETPFHPVSPYAVSKASAHWTACNYREAFGLYVACGILFNHESHLRKSNFFVKKVIADSLDIKSKKKEFLSVGNIDIKRDFGFAPKYVEAMWLMLQQENASDYLICSGKSISLREIIIYVFSKLEISLDRLKIDESLFRPTEIQDIYGDNNLMKSKLGWEYNLDFKKVLDILIEEEVNSRMIKPE